MKEVLWNYLELNKVNVFIKKKISALYCILLGKLKLIIIILKGILDNNFHFFTKNNYTHIRR